MTVVLFYVNRKPKLRIPPKLLPALLAPQVGPTFAGANTKVLYYLNRRTKVPQPRRLFPSVAVVPPPPVSFGGANTKVLYYTNRRPWQGGWPARRKFYSFGVPGPPTKKVYEWIIRARRRHRR